MIDLSDNSIGKSSAHVKLAGGLAALRRESKLKELAVVSMERNGLDERAKYDLANALSRSNIEARI